MKRILSFIAALIGIIVVVVIAAGFIVLIKPSFIFRDRVKKIPDLAAESAKEHKVKESYVPGQGIEELRLIESEVADRQIDPKAAENVLQPFLQSRNSNVSTEAAKALFRHNPARALDMLEKMESSQDKLVRINAIHALGEINSPEAVKILLDNLDEKDVDVKKEVIKSLLMILEHKKELVPEYLRDKIDKALHELKNKGTWIIE